MIVEVGIPIPPDSNEKLNALAADAMCEKQGT
jgi:hypothetical protein